MKSYIVVLLIISMAFYANGDIIDEIRDRLETLKSTVQAAVETGMDNVRDASQGAIEDETNNYAGAEIALDQEWADIWLSLLKIRELAIGYDISSCLAFREEVVLRLPQRCRDDINTCNSPYMDIIRRAPIDVNTIADYLEQIEWFGLEIDSCERTGSSILCLSPIDTQINLSQERFPQEIQVEVDRAIQVVEEASTNINQCIETGVSYMATGYDAVESISVCVNNIMRCGDANC